jgi:hypothetical protein
MWLLNAHWAIGAPGRRQRPIAGQEVRRLIVKLQAAACGADRYQRQQANGSDNDPDQARA